MRNLLARYAEPHRRYHTLQHLEECLALFSAYRSLAQRPAEVEMALWFHDATYDIPGAQNEERSAEWAERALMQAGVDAEKAQRVRALVLATRHNVMPSDSDAQLLVDIDLAILGASPARFAEYEQQIRAEVAHVPDALFRDKRRLILQGFLDRSPLFHTPAMRERYEAQAPANLRQALDAL